MELPSGEASDDEFDFGVWDSDTPVSWGPLAGQPPNAFAPGGTEPECQTRNAQSSTAPLPGESHTPASPTFSIGGLTPELSFGGLASKVNLASPAPDLQSDE